MFIDPSVAHRMKGGAAGNKPLGTEARSWQHVSTPSLGPHVSSVFSDTSTRRKAGVAWSPGRSHVLVPVGPGERSEESALSPP